MECKCETCRSACQKRPGWFAPGEVEKAAALLKMDPQDFFDKFISVDWFENDGKGPTYTLSPATVNCEPGTEYPFDPLGTCVFFQEGLCLIHAAKPAECSTYDHSRTNDQSYAFRDTLVEAWKNNRAEIEKYLGREPCRKEPDLFDMLSLIRSTIR